MKQQDLRFKIPLGPLKTGHTETFKESADPDFLELEEENLKFLQPVTFWGEAYLAEENFVLHLSIQAVGQVPCSICNKPVECPLNIEGLYHVVPVKEIHGSFFEMKDLIRETLLLEAPAFAECNGGECSSRNELKKYLRDPQKRVEEGFNPFSDLSLDE
jgi:uncharacterized metal-binding protein YceD (DUF177 family)